jgi:hypothetical protein
MSIMHSIPENHERASETEPKISVQSHFIEIANMRRDQARLWRALTAIGLALSFGLIMGLSVLRTAWAIDSVVTNCVDDVQLTQLLGNGGSITFNCNSVNAPATIVFHSQKIITQPTSIDGSNVITFSGGGLTRTFFVMSNTELALVNLTVFNGGPHADGGAVLNNGTLIVTNVTFLSNTTVPTSSYVGGGAIFNTGLLTVTNSWFIGNMGKYGGAIQSAQGMAFISGTTFMSNTAQAWGGAIDNDGAVALQIINSVFHDNLGAGGGAIDSDSTGILDISGSQFYNNKTSTYCCGAIDSSSALTMTNTSIYGNVTSHANEFAGGLYLYGSGVVSNVMIYNNVATSKGGGIYVDSNQFYLYNTTVAGNSAPIGGGLFVNSPFASIVTLTNVTMFGNTATSAGGNINGPASAGNTIIAGGVPNNCNEAILSSGHNLGSDNSCGLQVNGDITNTNPMLFPLADYGGPTWSMLPMAGSAAIDHGDDVICPSTDQRGVARPIGLHCDIGAVEFNLLKSIYLPLALKNF